MEMLIKKIGFWPCCKFRNHSGWGREDGDQGGDGGVDGHAHVVATDLQKRFKLSIVLTELLLKITAQSSQKNYCSRI